MVWWLLHTASAGLEICDGADNDGDGTVDEAPHLVFTDLDGDNYGDPESFVVLDTPCVQPNAAPPTDCDDSDDQIRPGVGENCDGVDNDCDGEVDAGLCLPCLRDDFEGDSYLRCGILTQQRGWVEAQAYCEDRGYVLAVPDTTGEQAYLESNASGTDRWVGLQDLDGDGTFLTWDDLVPPSLSWAPGEPLVLGPGEGTCALVLDQAADPGLSAARCDDDHGWICKADCPLRNWYLDEDGDGQGAGAPVQACIAPDLHVAIPGDCDDQDAERHSTASELCNGIDDDCDGVTDEVGSWTPPWYDDVDGDGAGDPATAVVTCSPTPDQVTLGGDCAPLDPDVFPGADEVCNGIDDDCDGDVDDDDPDLVDAPVWFDDGDGDGYGSTELISCSQPDDAVAVGGDCADDDPAIHPGADEICNDLDDDCSGTVDDITSGPAWYRDNDGDGLGDGSAPIYACTAPEGTLADGSDCDDSDPDVGTGLTWYLDQDGDGIAGPETVYACEQPVGSGASAEDCDDANDAVFPGADERCNGTDDDCDGTIDEDPIDADAWYVDADGDGFGGDDFVESCEPVQGRIATPGDCDDASASTNPDATELCNGTDDDCDGLIDDADPDLESGGTYFMDADGDGFGGALVQACEMAAGMVTNDSDCDDEAPERYPGAEEIGDDGIDQDCDGADLSYAYGNGADCGCSSSRPLLPRFWRR